MADARPTALSSQIVRCRRAKQEQPWVKFAKLKQRRHSWATLKGCLEAVELKRAMPTTRQSDWLVERCEGKAQSRKRQVPSERPSKQLVRKDSAYIIGFS